jgi:hypothetical protein
MPRLGTPSNEANATVRAPPIKVTIQHRANGGVGSHQSLLSRIGQAHQRQRQHRLPDVVGRAGRFEIGRYRVQFVQ